MREHDRRPLTEEEKRKLSETFNIPYEEIGDPDPERMYGESHDNTERLSDRVAEIGYRCFKMDIYQGIMLLLQIGMLIIQFKLLKKLI